MNSKVTKALCLAAVAHHDQFDKAGMPYIFHPVRVASHFEDETHQVVALLHDTVEDTNVDLVEIRLQFGPRVEAAVDALTHRPNETRHQYHGRIRTNQLAWDVKLADIADNDDEDRLECLDPEEAHRLRIKYADARRDLR